MSKARPLDELTEEVAAHPQPAARLRQLVGELEAEGRPGCAIRLFEQLLYRIDTRDFWLYERIWHIYSAMRPERREAAFLFASLAAQMAPGSLATGHAFNLMFSHLRDLGQIEAAARVLRYRLETCPEEPAVEPWAVGAVAAVLNEEERPGNRRPIGPIGDRRDHPIVPAQPRAPWHCSAVDGLVPAGLRALARDDMVRPAVTVSELRNAELLFLQNKVIVVDNTGIVHGDLSVSAYPAAVARKFRRMQKAGDSVTVYEVNEAVVISDYCPPVNLCHYLLDQLARLALYEMAGVDTTKVLVIGPQPGLAFRPELLHRAGVSQALGTERPALVRVQRLWVSSTCIDVRHTAHWGADWAIAYVRRILGGRGERGWRRLYISRADATRRRVVNEAEVLALLEPLGFECIVPGQMTYADQVTAFKQASHIVSPHGAALAHLVVCPPDTRLLEFFHPMFAENNFAQLVQQSGIDYKAMLAFDGQSDAPEWNDPAAAVPSHPYIERDIRVDLGRLKRYLATIS